MTERDLADATWESLTEDEREALTSWVRRRVEPRMQRALLETGVFGFTLGELHTWSTDPGGLFDHTDEPPDDAQGYVYSVDRDAGAVTVCDGIPIDASDPSGPELLYALAVAIGAQPPVSKCWPR